MRKILLGLLLIVTASYAQQVNFQSGISLTQVGNSVVVTVEADSFTDLYGYELSVNYDPACVNPTNIQEGTFLSSNGATLFNVGIIDNAVGIIAQNTGSLTGLVPGASGSGSLFSITFQGIAECLNSPLSFSDADFFDSNLNSITPVLNTGLITVASLPNTISSIPALPWTGLILLIFFIGIFHKNLCRKEH